MSRRRLARLALAAIPAETPRPTTTAACFSHRPSSSFCTKVLPFTRDHAQLIKNLRGDPSSRPMARPPALGEPARAGLAAERRSPATCISDMWISVRCTERVSAFQDTGRVYVSPRLALGGGRGGCCCTHRARVACHNVMDAPRAAMQAKKTPKAIAATLFEALHLPWRAAAGKLVVLLADSGPYGIYRNLP